MEARLSSSALAASSAASSDSVGTVVTVAVAVAIAVAVDSSRLFFASFSARRIFSDRLSSRARARCASIAASVASVRGETSLVDESSSEDDDANSIESAKTGSPSVDEISSIASAKRSASVDEDAYPSSSASMKTCAAVSPAPSASATDVCTVLVCILAPVASIPAPAVDATAESSVRGDGVSSATSTVADRPAFPGGGGISISACTGETLSSCCSSFSSGFPSTLSVVPLPVTSSIFSAASFSTTSPVTASVADCAAAKLSASAAALAASASFRNRSIIACFLPASDAHTLMTSIIGSSMILIPRNISLLATKSRSTE